ncbi:hypothetical protein EK21DRAFT_73727 [Setomelanomma holmii]|uniref:DH domain-containing protein n=1 Tax=Setomelanomma holmii TaxID=210430 RepID=A0A9P4LHD2_9PLEO|nr:hypothetical protein EK21DRAFT_73727 [Setomelanomma holmii]
MEPVSALFGIMAALPQCIQSAKELYDLRSRYKDASVLITAIYSESMVIAASLSQVQNLLQHDALQRKPQLLETFDRALTGCRVVYGCLEEEVRDLRIKAEANELKFKDRAKFLWKEDTFKELLTQIRGQQSALSLLIQGLQMESIADIRRLVEENSVTLDQVVKRSRTLRQSHPLVRVPESLFNHEDSPEDAAEAESIIKSTDFVFDDEVINSRAYHRAMALYTSQIEGKAPKAEEQEVRQDDPPAYDDPRNDSRTDETPGTLLQSSEDAPPLPPRRPSGQQLQSEDNPVPARSQSSDESTDTSFVPSILSKSPVSAEALENPQMHEIWKSLVNAEQKFVERLLKFRKMFYDNVLQQWPLLEQHLEAILVGEQLASLNREILLRPFEQHLTNNEGVVCDSLVFEAYANKAHKPYREYCQRMPHTRSSLRTTQSMDQKFGPFVNTVGLSIAWFGKSWEDYLKLPLSQLDIYAEHLQLLKQIANALPGPAASRELVSLRRATEAIEWLRTMASTIIEDAQSREDIQNLEKRIHTLDADIFSQLRLLDSMRRVRHQGSMAIKLKGQGPWHAVHVMLLDNYLLWGKVKPQKKGKGDRVVVLDSPIAIPDLEIQTSCDEHQFQKATMFDEIPRGSVIYIITMRDRTKDTKPHMFGAFGVQERKTWLEHINASAIVQSASET